MQLLIDVNDECIDHGVKLSSRACIVALACNNAMPGFQSVAGCFKLRWFDETGKLRYYAETPPELVDRMIAFDNGNPITPVQVTVELVEEHHQEGK